MTSLVQEKVEQAVDILDELHVDAWLTFVRETTETGDPVLPLILGQPVTWQSAFILTARGDRIAIVGKYEDEAVRSTGAWTEVTPYVEGIAEPLRQTLERLNPGRIAINYSEDDVKADGLTHGMRRLLVRHLAGTPFTERLVSAEKVIRALRTRKTRSEVARMRRAIEITDEIFHAAARHAAPGVTERAIHSLVHQEARQRQVGLAWEPAQCPIVTTGPGSMVGHGLPSDELTVREGCVFHLDFGVSAEGYCSDIQRCWYVPREGEVAPTRDIKQAFKAVVKSIDAAAAVLKPGVEGWEVDAAARATLIESGFPAYQHATGHHVGRAAHDGGGVLGPKWERYGATTCRGGSCLHPRTRRRPARRRLPRPRGDGARDRVRTGLAERPPDRTARPRRMISPIGVHYRTPATIRAVGSGLGAGRCYA